MMVLGFLVMEYIWLFLNCAISLLHGSKWNFRLSVVYCDSVGCVRGPWQLDQHTVCLELIWLSHNFILCLFGSPTILSCVYLAVPQFCLVSIWQSHSFVSCLFGSPTILSYVYLAVPQFCLVFILHRLHTKIYYFVLAINCGNRSLLYTSCTRLCHTHVPCSELTKFTAKSEFIGH
jgi:hypothetical protein